MASPVLIFPLCLDYGCPSGLLTASRPVSISFWDWASSCPTGSRTHLECWELSDLSSPLLFRHVLASVTTHNLRLCCPVGQSQMARGSIFWGLGLTEGHAQSCSDAAWRTVRALSWEPSAPAKPLCSCPLTSLGRVPGLSRAPQLSFQPRTAVGQCQAVPALRSVFYILTPLTQVPDPLSPVTSSWLWVLQAWPLEHDPLLNGPMELSASSFQLVLTSLGHQSASLKDLARLLALSPPFPSCPRAALLLAGLDKEDLHCSSYFPDWFPLCSCVPEQGTCIPLTVIWPPFPQGPSDKKIKILKENMSVLRLNKNLSFIIVRFEKYTYFLKKVDYYLNYHFCKIVNGQRPKKWLCFACNMHMKWIRGNWDPRFKISSLWIKSSPNSLSPPRVRFLTEILPDSVMTVAALIWRCSQYLMKNDFNFLPSVVERGGEEVLDVLMSIWVSDQNAL